jgi:hypothetical protein
VHGSSHVLAVALIVTQLSGCSLLELLLGVPPEPFPSFDPDEPFPFPTAEATFGEGSATIELDGETITLDEVHEDSSLGELGYSVTWENEEGWYLQLSGFPEEFGFPGGAYLTLHRIQASEHLVVNDPSRCVTTLDQADEEGITGSATCRGMEWTDFFSSYSSGFGGFPQPIEGMEPFDAEITFEAT